MEKYKKWNVNPNLVEPALEITLVNLIDDHLKKFKDRTAFFNEDHTFSYAQIDIYSQKLATFLQQLGAAKGSRITVMLPNIIQYPIAIYAILRAGYILVNVNPMYIRRELLHQLKDSGAEVLILLDHTLAQFSQLTECETLQYILSTDPFDFILPQHNEQGSRTFDEQNTEEKQRHIHFKTAIDQVEHIQIQSPELVQQDTALLQYTGGTTGISKDAELTHLNILFNIAQNSTVFNSHFGDRVAEPDEYIFCALPLYHIYGFTICLLSYGLFCGFANVLIANSRDLDALIDQYQRHPPTVFPGVNTLFNALIHHPRFKTANHSSLKSTTGGGGAVLKKYRSIVA